MASELVLVTGASGFIASHIVQQLLQAGHRVRGTVRDLNNDVKVKPLYSLCPDSKHSLELVEADLFKPETWKKAVEGCTYVIHVACSVSPDTSCNEDDLIKQGIEGNLTVLRACQEAKTVKRVVLTSSSIAVTMGSKDIEQTFDENDWLDASQPLPGFIKSKILSEKAAWDFMDALPKGEGRFELAVVNPGLVWGPVICAGSTSISTARSMLEGKMPMPHIQLAMVDVRDVAAAHISAMKTPDAAGKRHILCSESMWFKEVAEIIQEEFKPQGYKVSLCEVPYWLLKFFSFFSSSVRVMLPIIGNTVNVDSSRMVNVLQVKPRSMKESIVEMCYSMIETGQAKKTKEYTGPVSSKQDYV